jgi:hypothetical protein
MRYVMRILVLLLLAVLALPQNPAWAQRRGGWHRPHHTVVVGSAFYFGPSLWYPYSYPYPAYYYVAPYAAISTPPPIYVEKFEGTPNADSGEIFCPSSGDYYPDVEQCPNGWQRIIRPAETAAQGG